VIHSTTSCLYIPHAQLVQQLGITYVCRYVDTILSIRDQSFNVCSPCGWVLAPKFECCCPPGCPDEYIKNRLKCASTHFYQNKYVICTNGEKKPKLWAKNLSKVNIPPLIENSGHHAVHVKISYVSLCIYVHMYKCDMYLVIQAKKFPVPHEIIQNSFIQVWKSGNIWRDRIIASPGH
jgi:hypothetical protein